MSHLVKITPQTLSISPYISTTWGNISAIYTEKGSSSFDILVVVLKDQSKVEIPGLGPEILQEIFDSHSKFVSTEGLFSKGSWMDSPFTLSTVIREGMGELSFQQEPHQKDLPPLPVEALRKFLSIAKVFGFEEASVAPKENCECIFCQMARAADHDQGKLEEVSDEDLRFKDWEIQQTDQKLYRVTHPLDQNEYYDVFLGDPIGCTCGSKSCEHIKAVLSS